MHMHKRPRSLSPADSSLLFSRWGQKSQPKIVWSPQFFSQKVFIIVTLYNKCWSSTCVRFLMCDVRVKNYTAPVYKKVVNSTQKCLKNSSTPQSSHRFPSGLTLLTNKQANNRICHDIKMPPPLPTPSLTCISLSKSCRFKILYLLLNPCQTKAYIYYSYSSRMPQTMRENCEKRYGTYTSY